MAVHTHNAASTGLPWIDVMPNGTIDWLNDPVSRSSTLIVLANSDGTQTRIIGTNLTVDPTTGVPTGGIVTSVQRVNPSMVFPPLERIDGPAFSDLNFPFSQIDPMFAEFLMGDDTMNGYAGSDFLLGSSGADVLNGGDGFDFADYAYSFGGVTASLADPNGNTGAAVGDVLANVLDQILLYSNAAQDATVIQ